jgi:prolyl-tRNA editing enzyme YbaK/EbsC (Cys-tRNA(Pro) deacylase)
VKPAVQRVVAAFAARGVQFVVTEFAESTRPGAAAAAAIGTSVPRIVKSLVFIAQDRPLLVLASGSNRVDVAKLERLTGATIRRADADRVRVETGYSIGGVPPLGHAGGLTVYVDADLLQYDRVWAAAGTPYAVFPIRPEQLVELTGGTVADVKEAT